MSWLFFALLAPALWAITNLFDDNLMRRAYRSGYVGAGVSGVASLLALCVLPFVDFHPPHLGIALLGLGAGALIIAAYVLYYRSLQHDAPSVTVAIWGISPAFLPFAAYAFFGELLSLREYAGFAIMLLGAVLLAAPDWRRMRFSKALPLMLLAALITAALVLMEKEVYRRTEFWSGFTFVILGMAFSGAALLACTRDGRSFLTQPSRWQRYLPYILATEIIGAVGNAAGSYAIMAGPVSLVQVVKGIQPVFVLLYAAILTPFFPSLVRETWGKHAAQKLVLMVVMLFGLYLIG